jgi:hypothetical protein
MPKCRFKLLPAVRVVIGMTICTSLISCSKISQGHEVDQAAYKRADDWKTVCLGRFLIDLPNSAELGATEVKYKGTYQFAGLNAGNAWGTLRYGDMQIRETIPTADAGFRDIRLAAQVRITSPQNFKKLIKARQADLDYIKRRIAQDSPEQAADDAGLLAEAKEQLASVIHDSKVTGEAKLNDVNGFAVRYGVGYALGFLAAEDRRVRTFIGDRIRSKIDTAQAAAEEYQRVRETYHPRAPTEIPSGPGFCTYYGFIDESGKPEADVHMRVPIQIKQYPNLILALEIEPASTEGPRDIQKLPSMDVAHNALDKIGVKRTHGPTALQILGTPGRSYAQEYSDNCSSTSCRPADQAYDMEARTFGDPARVDRPRLLLHMTAAISDDYKLKRPAEPKGYNVPDRPALSGHVPPPFEVGQEIFDQVLRSIRVRPGAIATSQHGQAN